MTSKSAKSKSKPKYKSRPLTTDTEFLVCIYHYRNDSIRNISDTLERPTSQIRRIIKNAKESGRYNKHINKYLSVLNETQRYYPEYSGGVYI